ncbi:MAG: NAD-dependent epimerase/dehydratase family protein [Planctomycetaceae bacterium]
MNLTASDIILVTGASGFVGSHVVERGLTTSAKVRAFVRPASDTSLLEQWDIPIVRGELHDPLALKNAFQNVTVVVHCAAKVGDWGPIDEYRKVNVSGVERMIAAARACSTVKRFIHISSLGVYSARDHYGTDESVAPAAEGFDGYTRTKIEGEQVIGSAFAADGFPAVILRPGFIYGPRDRTVLPRLLAKLHNGRFRFLGDGEKVLNNTYVGNLMQAIFQAIAEDGCLGKIYNVTDARLVTRKEFIAAIAQGAGYPIPVRSVPIPVAKGLAWGMETFARLTGKKEGPLLSQAKIKFLALNLDFSIERARRELKYNPPFDFRDAIVPTMNWFRDSGLVP